MREVGSYPFVSDSNRLLSDKPLKNEKKGVFEIKKILKLENLFLKDVAISRKRRVWYWFFEKKKARFFLLQR